MSKLYAVAEAVRDKMKDLPREKLQKMDETMSLTPEEYVGLMNLQARLFASGKISKEDAMFFYNTLKDWESGSDIASKYVVLEVLRAYMQGYTQGLTKERKVTRKPAKKKTTR